MTPDVCTDGSDRGPRRCTRGDGDAGAWANFWPAWSSPIPPAPDNTTNRPPGSRLNPRNEPNSAPRPRAGDPPPTPATTPPPGRHRPRSRARPEAASIRARAHARVRTTAGSKQFRTGSSSHADRCSGAAFVNTAATAPPRRRPRPTAASETAAPDPSPHPAAAAPREPLSSRPAYGERLRGTTCYSDGPADSGVRPRSDRQPGDHGRATRCGLTEPLRPDWRQGHAQIKRCRSVCAAQMACG